MELSNVPVETPAPGPWNRRRRLTLGLTALALVAGGGVALAAGTPDPDPTSAAPEAATAAAKPFPGNSAFGLGRVLHSESVVSDGNGGYVAHLMQMGKIESIDSDRLTVVSEDGYERSWNRTSETVMGGGWSVSKNDDGSYTVKKDTDELAVGDQVLVTGTLTEDVATAQRVAARPDTGEIPGMVMKRLEGEFADRPGDRAEAPPLRDRLMKRFEGDDQLVRPGPMGAPGEDGRRFEPPTPERAELPSEEAVPS